MLSKEYLVTGIFPKFGSSARQLTVDKRLGVPTRISTTLLRRHHVVDKYLKLRHGLKYPITFYAVTEFGGARLVSISDGVQTRYYWLTSTRYHSYLADKSSRSYEQAWCNLFEFTTLDGRKSTQQFSRAMVGFFKDLTEELTERGNKHLQWYWRLMHVPGKSAF